jgi:hypothetical protein
MGSRLFRGPHDTGDGADELFPVGLFFGKLAFAGGGEAVIFGAAVGFGLAPLGGEPALFFEAVQGGIEGAVFDLQGIGGAGAEGLTDAVAMLGAPLQGAEDEHVEGALQDFDAVAVGFAFGHLL